MSVDRFTHRTDKCRCGATATADDPGAEIDRSPGIVCHILRRHFVDGSAIDQPRQAAVRLEGEGAPAVPGEFDPRRQGFSKAGSAIGPDGDRCRVELFKRGAKGAGRNAGGGPAGAFETGRDDKGQVAGDGRSGRGQSLFDGRHGLDPDQIGAAGLQSGNLLREGFARRLD